MLFNSFPFMLFFAALLCLYWGAPRHARNAVLLSASLLFYALWIPTYLVLLLFTLGVNYALLRGMVRSPHPRRHLIAAIVFTLGLLAYFKYAAFTVTSLLSILGILGIAPEIPAPFLPLGISFYSFQILSLTIDAYRRRIDPVKSFSRYVLFISFFPQLIAGPILRGHQFLPQLESGGDASLERVRRGLWLLISGVVKKVIFADYLLSGFVDDVFMWPEAASAPFTLIAIYSFAFQIYFDFSGYTDMARGLACLLGFEIPPNFLEPYLARNPSEFWRRWHITLSRWLQDYLYIPLGGNRRGVGHSYLNLMITMLLGGLWHGAAWTFVGWGAFHGGLLVLYRRFGWGKNTGDAPLCWRDLPSIVVMFHCTCFAWVMFRAPTFGNAWDVYTQLFTQSYFERWPVFGTGVVLLCILMHPLERIVRLHLSSLRARVAGSGWGMVLDGAVAGCALALAIAVSGSGGEFIYFQF